MYGGREDFLLVKEATLENRNINFILSNLLEKEEWHTVMKSTRLNCVVTLYKMRKKMKDEYFIQCFCCHR